MPPPTRRSPVPAPVVLICASVLAATAAQSAGVSGGCDLVVSSDASKNGSVASPSFPQPYAPRTHCRYDFQGRGRERVQLVFTDFSLYHPADDQANECESTDSLMAYVLIEGRMEKIDEWCGATVPRQLMSNGPRLMLEFRGVYSSRYARGFRANYAFTENFGVTTGVQHDILPCAFMYNASSGGGGGGEWGWFASPNFPGLYPRDTECHYFFYAAPDHRVRLHFHYFDIEGVLPCEASSASDYVELSNYMARDRKYGRHCGQLRDFAVESDRRFFRVTFWSNDRLDGTGFNASYRFVADADPADRTHRPQAAAAAPAAPAAHVWWLWLWIGLLSAHIR